MQRRPAALARLSSLPPLQFYPIPVVEPVGQYPDPVHGVPDAIKYGKEYADAGDGDPAECEQLEDPGHYVATRSLGDNSIDIFPSQVFLGSNQILGLFWILQLAV